MSPTALNFQDTCLIYPATVNDYGQDVLGSPAIVPCMLVQTTGYEHSSSQDAIVGTTRIAFPPDDTFILAQAFRLEGLVVEVNAYGADATAQRFKIASVDVARDVLLGNEVQHVECELKKVQVAASVS